MRLSRRGLLGSLLAFPLAGALPDIAATAPSEAEAPNASGRVTERGYWYEPAVAYRVDLMRSPDPVALRLALLQDARWRLVRMVESAGGRIVRWEGETAWTDASANGLYGEVSCVLAVVEPA